MQKLAIDNELNYLNNYDFAKHSQILAVSIFGSKALGKGRSASDIDVAIIVDDDFDLLENYDLPLIISSKLEDMSGGKVDVVIFNKMDPLFKTEIRVNGRLIYVQENEKLKKILFNARKEYEDYLVWHKYYTIALKKRYLNNG